MSDEDASREAAAANADRSSIEGADRDAGTTSGDRPLWLSDSSIEAFVAESYRVALGREPDAEGAEHHRRLIQEGRLSPLELLRALIESVEREDVQHAIPVPDALPGMMLTQDACEDFVVEAYRTALGREPEVDGIELHCRLLVEGQLSPAELLRALFTSAEREASSIRGAHGEADSLPTDGTGALSSQQVCETFVTETYQAILGRPPELDGLQFHASALLEGRVDAVRYIQELVHSPEAMVRQDGSNADTDQLVIEGFRAILLRDPEPSGLEHFSRQLRSSTLTPGDFVRLLSGSQEGARARLRAGSPLDLDDLVQDVKQVIFGMLGSPPACFPLVALPPEKPLDAMNVVAELRRTVQVFASELLLDESPIHADRGSHAEGA